MPSLYGVGCACVFVGAWSYLVTSSAPTFSFYRDSPDFKLNGCYLLTTKPYCLTLKINSYGRDIEINLLPTEANITSRESSIKGVEYHLLVLQDSICLFTNSCWCYNILNRFIPRRHKCSNGVTYRFVPYICRLYKFATATIY